VTLDDWKRATLDKGIARIASGAAAATDDVADFMGELIPYQERVKEELKNMPNTTLADSIARQSFWTTKMADFQRSG
jgi:predicted transcriptional regulator